MELRQTHNEVFFLTGEGAIESGNHACKPLANVWLP